MPTRAIDVGATPPRAGAVYEGGFVKGVRHGTGVYKWGDGMEFRGGFEEGLQHGCGLQVGSRGREGIPDADFR